MNAERTCPTCRFWRQHEGSSIEREHGECRRRAPVPFSSTTTEVAMPLLSLLTQAVYKIAKIDIEDLDLFHREEEAFEGAAMGWRSNEWPETSLDDWCGEWEGKPSADGIGMAREPS
ncbi:hypothetical protein [Bradyrhizobium sp. Ash2021]|uniref:hypothetical protein n=1 Tax=Bradyrhizobium sp. Ash2021 TaxID=2954771 RepID=UPI0028160A02|nr:hypothetical protein [Bradyrhizobium sp. Ash2021]WMT77464.1 hypothetical protein NL528_14390 [Bradyrhizobium sp. Ash2021]